MNEIKIFENAEFGQIRTVKIDGEPWFVGKDVADVLIYNEPHKAVVRHVDAEDRTKYPILTKGGEQETWIINESGLYALIFGSKLPTAKKFKHWVTSEVLPSIRKTGGYTMGNHEDDKNIYLEAARIMGNIPNSRRYVVNILRHIVPDINDGEPSENKTSSSGYTKPWNAIGFSSYLDRVHISASELSALTGLGRSQISGYKNGFIRPGEVARKKITDALNLEEGHFSRESRRRK